MYVAIMCITKLPASCVMVAGASKEIGVVLHQLHQWMCACLEPPSPDQLCIPT